jgi:hypothetical protein
MKDNAGRVFGAMQPIGNILQEQFGLDETALVAALES